MKLDKPWMRTIGSAVAVAAAEALYSTMDSRAAFVAPWTDPYHPDCPNNVLYALWHEYLLSPVWARRNLDITMLVSKHRDAQWLTAIGRRWGYEIVEGSTNKGGAAAVREILKLADRRLAMTPDGPRGPRRQMASGPLWLASRQRRPLICVGVGCERPWRLKSWDRFAIPRPGSRMRLMFGEPILLPPRMSSEQLETARLWAEGYLNELTLAAEQWAESGNDDLPSWPLGNRSLPQWAIREDVFAPSTEIAAAPAISDAGLLRRAA